MKKTISALLFLLLAFILSACSTGVVTESTDMRQNIPPPPPTTSMSVIYITFEEALLRSTDVVIAQYVGHRPFGETLTEFQFTVLDRILGYAADTIFVYTSNRHVSISDDPGRVSYYNRGELSFTHGTNYLLPLEKLRGSHGKTHDDGFLFIHNLVINLEDPTESTMYGESLSLHVSGVAPAEMNFTNNNVMRSDIISFVRDFTANNTLARIPIRSEDIEDIIHGSPHVLVVEVNEPFRLVAQQATRDWVETDIYNVTVLQTLKGDFNAGNSLLMIFLAYTVQPGERHIIAIEPVDTRGLYQFTSRNSLFHMNQLTEIMQIPDFCPDHAAYLAWREAVRQAEAEYRAWREWLHNTGQCVYPCTFCAAHEAYLAWREAMRQAEAEYRAWREWLHNIGQCVHPCMFCD